MAPYPATERVLFLWVTDLYETRIAGSSLKLYLMTLRNSQIAIGLGDPWMGDWPRPSYVVRGLKKTRREGKTKHPHLPITPEILLGL